MAQSKNISFKNIKDNKLAANSKDDDAIIDEKSKDDAVTSLIRGLNFLITHSKAVGLGTAAKILYSAKEDLVYWAVEMNFHETTKDRFICQHLFDSQMCNAVESGKKFGE